jgi:hypothetical protein
MTPELREYVETHKLEHATVKRVIEMLPEDHMELDALIGGIVEEGHVMGFVFVITAALETGLCVDARHLRECVSLMPGGQYLGQAFWQMRGNKVSALMHALTTQITPPSMHLHGLLAIAAWCRAHHGGVLPEGYLAEVRKLFRHKMSREPDRALAGALAFYLDDPDVIAVAVEGQGNVLKQENVKVISRRLAESIVATYPTTILVLISDVNHLLAMGTHIRRVAPKMSRNAPCHCGSGQKYKRCCHDKDQERARFPSAVPGKTQAELARAPEQYVTVEEFQTMNRDKVRRLNPLKLKEEVLAWYLLVLATHGLFTEVAVAIEKLGWRSDLDHYEDSWINALTFATWRGEPESIERIIRARYPDGDVPEGVLKPEVELMRLNNDPAAYRVRQEAISAELMRTQDPERQEALGHALLNVHTPATSLLMAQGLLPVMAKSKVQFLHKQMQHLRDQLLLPAEDPFAEILERRFADAAVKSQGKDAAKLREANDRLQVKASELREANEKMERLRRELRLKEKEEKRAAAKEAAPPTSAELEAMKRLREKVETQQGIINGYVQERAQMRQEMASAFAEAEEHRKQQPAAAHANEAMDTQEEEALMEPTSLESKQPLRLLDYPKKFHETLTSLPSQVSRAAQILLGRLAAGEPSAFVGIVALRARPDTLRVRVGSDHRLLFRLHATTLEVVDLINRRDLDRRVKGL